MMNKKTKLLTLCLGGLLLCPPASIAESNYPNSEKSRGGANMHSPDSSAQSGTLQPGTTGQPGTMQSRDKNTAARDTYNRASMRNSEASSQQEDLIRQATSTYQKLTKDEKIADLAARAKCIAIFPDVTSAALVIGGKSSNGIATCNGEEQKWSKVTFLDMKGASIGAQIGARSTEMVFFLMSDKAKEALNDGKFTLGADLSYTYGKSGAELSADNAGKDVVAISKSDGAFAGASLTSTMISVDQTAIEEYYRGQQSHKTVLNNYESSEDSGALKEFKQALSS